MSFAENLLRLRESNGIKQLDLIAELGISLRTYQYYESGQREPPLSTLVALADFYDLSLDELVGRER